MGATEDEGLLAWLAVKRKVAVATHQQAGLALRALG
jgi:hypothetical protein